MIIPVISAISTGVLAKFVAEFEDWKMRRREKFWECIEDNTPQFCYSKIQKEYPMPNKFVIYSILFGLAGLSIFALFNELSKK